MKGYASPCTWDLIRRLAKGNILQDFLPLVLKNFLLRISQKLTFRNSGTNKAVAEL